MTPDSRDGYADQLAAIACQLVARVRDEGPDDNEVWLRAVTDERQRHDLLYVLAAAVPDDRPWHELTAWAALRPVHALVAERFRLDQAV